MPSGNILERLVRFPGLLSPPPANIDYGKDESYHTVTPEQESSEHTERHFARSLKNRQTLAVCYTLAGYSTTTEDSEGLLDLSPHLMEINPTRHRDFHLPQRIIRKSPSLQLSRQSF